ncbi:exonuclease [Arthrobacter sp. Hiyo4]|nr:exonuclease [Arthrobacter sp. Hiyo4]
MEARLPDEERLHSLVARRAALSTKQQELTQKDIDLGVSLQALRSEQETLTAGLEPLAELASAAILHAKEAAAAEELLDVVRRYAAARAAQGSPPGATRRPGRSSSRRNSAGWTCARKDSPTPPPNSPPSWPRGKPARFAAVRTTRLPLRLLRQRWASARPRKPPSMTMSLRRKTWRRGPVSWATRTSWWPFLKARAGTPRRGCDCGVRDCPHRRRRV